METSKIEKNLYIRVIEYGIGKPDGFTPRELFEDKKAFLSQTEKEVIRTYFQFAYANHKSAHIRGEGAPTDGLFLMTSYGNIWDGEPSRYVLSLEAIFNYLDFQELKLAKKHAKEARWLATIAIAISIGAVLVSIFMPIFIAQWFTQTIRIDSDQLQNLLDVRATIPPSDEN